MTYCIEQHAAGSFYVCNESSLAYDREIYTVTLAERIGGEYHRERSKTYTDKDAAHKYFMRLKREIERKARY